MAYDNYTDFLAEVTTRLNRGDLSAQLPGFISLVEAKIKRKLRRTTVQADIAIIAAETQLPSDCAELRAIHFNSGIPTRDTDLMIVTPSMLADCAAPWNGTAARPVAACVLSGTGMLLVAPMPDQQYDATITYYQQITPLTAANPTNAVFLESPDLYLYGVLGEAALHLEDPALAAIYKPKFDEALNDLAVARDREEAGAGLRPIRLPWGGFDF